jgi:hypothetical protein
MGFAIALPILRGLPILHGLKGFNFFLFAFDKFIKFLIGHVFKFGSGVFKQMKFFYFLFKCRNPILRRHVLHLKFGVLFLKLKNLRLKLANILLEAKGRRLERILNIEHFHDDPELWDWDVAKPNAGVTGA